MDKLSDQQRQVLFMSMEGCKVKEIAEQLGVSENSVKTQKKRAYAFVREELGEGLAILIFFLFSWVNVIIQFSMISSEMKLRVRLVVLKTSCKFNSWMQNRTF